MNELNHGVLIDQRPTDFIGGTLPYKVILQDGNWTPYITVGEKQFDNKIDYMACVSYSALNCIEIQQKQWSGKEINLSDRFTAKLSNTTPQGNYQYIVADSIRLNGCVLESDYLPSPDLTWDQYYQSIPTDVMAKMFKVDMSYEWIDCNLDQLRYHLKHAPIQITIPGQNPNHAVALINIDSNNVLHYFDSYPGTGDYLKTMTSMPATAMKLVLNQPIKLNDMKLVEQNGGYVLEGEKGYIGISKVEFLNELLKITDQIDHRAPVGNQVGIIETANGFIIK